jgi:hydrogenase expression/formation protein HypC
MCLAVPMKVIEKEGVKGKVGSGSVTYEVSFALYPDAGPGDYVLVHAGFVIEKIEAEEAVKTLALFDEMLRTDAGGDP